MRGRVHNIGYQSSGNKCFVVKAISINVSHTNIQITISLSVL